MEDFFNLAPVDSTEEISDVELISEEEDDSPLGMPVVAELTTLEKIDLALPKVDDLSKHDQEMDDISTKAITAFNDLIVLGGNVPDVHAGKIFEVAGQMLKTALDARNAKTERKIKVVELQLKKAKLDQVAQNESGTGPRSSGEFDRNELIS